MKIRPFTRPTSVWADELVTQRTSSDARETVCTLGTLPASFTDGAPRSGTADHCVWNAITAGARFGCKVFDVKRGVPRALGQPTEGTIEHRKSKILFVPADASLPSVPLDPAQVIHLPRGAKVVAQRSVDGAQLEISAARSELRRDGVGVVEEHKGALHVRCGGAAPRGHLVPLEGAARALLGHAVVVRFDGPLEQRVATVASDLGPAGGACHAMAQIVADQGVEISFSPQIMHEVTLLPRNLPATGVIDPITKAPYRDLTHLRWFSNDAGTKEKTISKDIDQLRCLVPNPHNPEHMDVYSAIADTGFFFRHLEAVLGRPSEMEKRAEARGLTHYTPAGVYPMLPEEACENLMSLLEGQIRPAFVTKVTINEQGIPVGEPEYIDAMVRAIVNSNYAAEQAYYDGEPMPFGEAHKAQLELQRALMARMKLPTSNLPELWGKVDEAGKLEPVLKASLMTQEVEAQLSRWANGVAGETIAQAKVAGVFRRHDPPKPPRLAAAKRRVKALGLTWKRGESPAQFAARMRPHIAKEHAALLAARSCYQRAYLSTEAGPHAGMGLAGYAWQTAPMRRDSDRFIHDVVRALRDGREPPGLEKLSKVVQSAERVHEVDRAIEGEVGAYLKARALRDLGSAPVSAQIVNAAPHGIEVYIPAASIYVGIRASLLHREKLTLDERALALEGPGGARFEAGTDVQVQVTDVDVERGTYKVSVITPRTETPRPRGTRGRRGRR